MVTRNCNECQAPYEAEQRYLNRGQGLFCSRACSGLYHGRLKLSPDIACAECGKMFHRPAAKATDDKLRFCSLTCRNSSSLVKHGPEPTGQHFQTCVNCHGKHESPTFDTCIRCRNFIKVAEWWNGNSEIATATTYGAKTWVKKFLVALYGDQCQQCGFNERRPDGASIIQMDHIDGNCTNNLKENLRLLCPNCHAMTETYGSRNRGSGRAHRRKNG